MLTIRTILCPTDFSEPSRPAFDLACALARDYGAELVVAHVMPPPLTIGSGGVLMAPPLTDATELRSRLEQVRPADPGVAVRHRLTAGHPLSTSAEAEGILAVAAEEKADLIVMGTHGRGGLSRLLTGSVAEAVLRKAPCPVLTVKAPLPADRGGSPEAVAAQPVTR
jgi:nucleotide-binding universal stress UspA family protein